jgi:hypothetical protein
LVTGGIFVFGMNGVVFYPITEATKQFPLDTAMHVAANKMLEF